MNKKNSIIVVLLLIIIVLLAFIFLKQINYNNELRDYNKKLEEENLELKEAIDNRIESKDNTDKRFDSNERAKQNNSEDNSSGKINSSISKDVQSKEILFFNKTDLADMTKEDMSFASIDSIHSQLTNETLWMNEGFTETDGMAIANRFASSPDQAKGILKGVVNQNKSLKLILIPLNNGLKVNIGSTSPNYK